MPKITAHFGKKVPGSGQFSSQQFCASIEAECDADDQETLRNYLRRLFALAKESVEEQLHFAGSQNGHGQATVPSNGTAQSQKPALPQKANGSGNGGHVPATASQKKAVFAICKSVGRDPAQYGIDSLTLREASRLIDELKSQQASAR